MQNWDWSRLLPFMNWLPGTNRKTLRDDFLAGLTGAIVVLPQGVAFATIAGMPPEYGLYAGMIPAIIAALFGSSHHLVSGPTTAASIVLYASLSVHAEPGTSQYVTLALTLTFMVGVIQLALGFARLGGLVNFISHSVIVGFTAGAAVLIAAKQLKHYFGIHIERGGNLWEILEQFVHQLDHINPWVTAVATITLLSGVIVKRWWPKMPYMIVAMVVGSIVAWYVNLRFGGELLTGIKTVGALPQNLPPLSMPHFDSEVIQELSPAAVVVTMFALTEAVSIGRSLSAKSGQRISGNQEFIGQGLSNLAGAFFSGYVATGSFNRSGLNYQAGAKTPLAAVFAGALLMGIVLLVAPLAAYLPNAAMAGILFLVAWGLIDFKEIRHIIRASRREMAVLGVTFFGALFLDLDTAILSGVLLSLMLYLQRTSKPRIFSRVPNPAIPERSFVTDPELPECPQLKILRIDGSLFFGSINHVEETLAMYQDKAPEQKHMAIVASGINFADITGGEVLVKEAEKRRERGGGLYLIDVKPGLRESLEASGSLGHIGANNVYAAKERAIAEIYTRLDKEICARCDKRIFTECGNKP